jgi:hypothetical protein
MPKRMLSFNIIYHPRTTCNENYLNFMESPKNLARMQMKGVSFSVNHYYQIPMIFIC